MAEDTRESDRPEATPIEQSNEQQQQDSTPQPKKPKHEFPKSQVGKLWDAFGSPEEPVNILPGAKYSNAAELKNKYDVSASIPEVITSGNGISDIKSFYRTPCARDSLMLGIGAGFGVGGIRGIVGGILLSPIPIDTFSLHVKWELGWLIIFRNLRTARGMACMQLGGLHMCDYFPYIL